VNVVFTVDAPPVVTEETVAAARVEEADGDVDAPLLAGRSEFVAEVDARTAVRPGRRVRLSLDPARFHYFDPDTGLAIRRAAEAPAVAAPG
jgi:multiple sugar transport system ATP-binding protein